MNIYTSNFSSNANVLHIELLQHSALRGCIKVFIRKRDITNYLRSMLFRVLSLLFANAY